MSGARRYRVMDVRSILTLRTIHMVLWYCQSAESVSLFFGVTTISLKIPDAWLSRLDAVARAGRKSRSALFREALEEKLQAVGRKSPPSLYERSADLCGSEASDVGDFASNPRHLEGFGS